MATGAWGQTEVSGLKQDTSERKMKLIEVLTVASSHSSIVVGHSNEVVHVGPGLGVANKLRHVQVSGGR